MDAPTGLHESWRPVSLDEGTCVRLSGADCTVWARRYRDEWMIAGRHDHLASPTNLSRSQVFEWPEDLEWTRYVTVDRDALEIAPVLPDRPTVVRPKAPITIMSGRWARFYFSVPLWIQFTSHPPGKPRVMCEIPSVRLSDTWFGTPANGDLCYALDSTLERSSADLDIGLRAVCSLILRNSAKEDLKFERIAVHVEHLKLFSADDRFWTNEITVAFRGTEEVSNVTYGTTPPSTVSGACRVSGPRQSFDRSLIKRSFNLFREIAGI